jgi:EAL domain-containing protein (putative c-di-GMP-specific phosphodiesterase class I)
MGDPQRLTNTEQLEILALLEAASTEHSAVQAARALAELMRHLHVLGLRIAVELPDQDRDGKPAAH